MKLRDTLPALADLSAILDYIAAHSPQGARRVQARIHALEISQPLLPIGMKTPMSMIACQHCDVPPAAGNMHAKSRNSAARPMP